MKNIKLLLIGLAAAFALTGCGTYSYDKPTLSGRYSDNTPWGSASYRVSFNADGTRMTLTSTSSTSDVSVFVKAEIPSEIISGALESTPQSRAEDMPRFL